MRIAAEQIIEEQGGTSFYGEEVELPPRFFLLSRGGSVRYYGRDDVVLFYTNPGVIDNRAGYLYFPHKEHSKSHDDTAKQLYDYYYGLVDYEDKGSHWEYCSFS